MEPRLAGTPVAATVTAGYGRGVPVRQRGTRNGLPPAVPYTYRGRCYPWARAVLAAAEAKYGKPGPVCACGAPMTSARACLYGRCERC